MSNCNLRLLVSIFSHERFIGLRNAVLSVERFIPSADILIIDDESLDSRIPHFLDEQAKRGKLRWRRTEKVDACADRRLGNLHSNMNAALRTAVESQYNLLLLLQDDQQILWLEDGMLSAVYKFLSESDDALMLDPRFMRFTTISKRFKFEQVEFALAMPRGAVDVGFIAPSHAAKIGFTFGGSERESSNRAIALGQRCYQSRLPFVADVPTYLSLHLRPPFFRGRQWEQDSEAEFSQCPILRPLDTREINLIKSCPIDKGIIAEDVVQRNDGRSYLLPHYYNATALDRYRQLVLTNWMEFLARRSAHGRDLSGSPPDAPHASAKEIGSGMRLRHRVPTIGRVMLLWESVKTGLFLLFIYPVIRVWMRRNSQSFLHSLDRTNQLSAAALLSRARAN